MKPCLPGADPINLNDADIEKLTGLITSIENTAIYDEALFNIVQAEFNAYMGSSATAEEAAARIQSRASIYVAEQYG